MRSGPGVFPASFPALLDGPAAGASLHPVLPAGGDGGHPGGVQSHLAHGPPADIPVVTMTAGFYAAVLVLRARLQVALPSAETLWLLLGFAVVSFLVERVATLALCLADQARLRGEGRRRQNTQ